MNRIGNTYWLSNRHPIRVTAQALPDFSALDMPRKIIPATAIRLALIPSWVFLGMILLSTLGICSTVILRTRAESNASYFQYQRMVADLDTARRANESLQLEIHRMTTDPSIIESAARTRLGMVRPNDIVILVDSVKQGSTLGTLSFVR